MFKSVVTLIGIVMISACANKELSPLEEQEKRAELLERCQKLKKDMDDLKGKPLRRNASTQAFEDECFVRNETGY